MDNLTIPKDKRWRCSRYIAWVKKLTCVLSGITPAGDAHHIIAEGQSGAGLTAPDWASMPLTRGKHTEMHNNPELWEKQWPAVSKTLLKAFKAGIFVVTPGREEEFADAIGGLLNEGCLKAKDGK